MFERQDSAQGATHTAAAQNRGRRRPPAKGRIRILVVDDHEVVRYGLRQVLEREPDMEIVGEAGAGVGAHGPGGGRGAGARAVWRQVGALGPEGVATGVAAA